MGRILTPTERKIWRLFQETQTPHLKNIWFETAILKVRPTSTEPENPEQLWWETVNSLKIDVLWNENGEWSMAEIEQELNMEAIGQALCYRELWNELNPGTPIKKAWIITATDDPRLHAALKAASLTHYLVTA